MDNIHIEEEQEPTVRAVTPIGARLRSARERANLTLEDVAAHLRLTCQLVHDIENDDYTHARRHLVFLRGYLRAYAKLVELPPDEIINTFNLMKVEDIPIVKPSWQTEEAQEMERAQRSNWLAFIALSSILIVGVVAWWYSQYFGFGSLVNFFNHSVSTIESQVAPQAISSSDQAGNKQRSSKHAALDVEQGNNAFAPSTVHPKESPKDVHERNVIQSLPSDIVTVSTHEKEAPAEVTPVGDSAGEADAAQASAHPDQHSEALTKELKHKRRFHARRTYRRRIAAEVGEMSPMDQSKSDWFPNQLSKLSRNSLKIPPISSGQLASR